MLTIFLVYSCIPRQLVFKGDSQLQKLANQPDEYQDYKYKVWKDLGYIDYVTQLEYAKTKYGSDSPQVSEALVPGSPFYETFKADFSAKVLRLRLSRSVASSMRIKTFRFLPGSFGGMPIL